MRQLEFESAFLAEMRDYFEYNHHPIPINDDDDDDDYDCDHGDGIKFDFVDALSFPRFPSSPSSSGSTTTMMISDRRRGEYRDGDGGAEEEEDASRYHHRATTSEFDIMPPSSQIEAYESGMQYVTMTDLPSRIFDVATTMTTTTTEESGVVATTTPLDAIFANAIGRCSLVRAAYEIVAAGRSYEELAKEASRNGSFADLAGSDAPTWSIRLRRYGVLRDDHRLDDASDDDDDGASRRDEDGHSRARLERRRGRVRRFGKNARSSLREERNAILSMAELVRSFGGRVDLTDPTCRIYRSTTGPGP